MGDIIFLSREYERGMKQESPQIPHLPPHSSPSVDSKKKMEKLFMHKVNKDIIIFCQSLGKSAVKDIQVSDSKALVEGERKQTPGQGYFR